MNSSWPKKLIAHIHSEHRTTPGLSPYSILVLSCIFLAVSVQILETEPILVTSWGHLFALTDQFVGAIFILDFIARITFPPDPRYTGILGRVKYLIKPKTIIDLCAILPFIIHPYIELLEANDLAFLRLLQLVKIFRVADLGPVSHGLKRVGHALSQKKVELAISVGVAFLAIVLAASFLYLAEATVQPEAFGSIPRALWWSLATLTTVGYGDVAPITPLGKILGGFVAIIGVGIIAMPAGILASSFSSLPETKSESK